MYNYCLFIGCRGLGVEVDDEIHFLVRRVQTLLLHKGGRESEIGGSLSRLPCPDTPSAANERSVCVCVTGIVPVGTCPDTPSAQRGGVGVGERMIRRGEMPLLCLRVWVCECGGGAGMGGWVWAWFGRGLAREACWRYGNVLLNSL